MLYQNQPDLTGPRGNVAADEYVNGNRVLRDTYRLLSVTLIFSAVIALSTAALRLPVPGILLTLAGYFGFLYATYRFRNSIFGLVSVFGLTGFLGYTIGPMLTFYLSMNNGPQLVATSVGVTGLTFFGLSAYARSDKAVDATKWGSILFTGILAMFGLGLAALFFQLSAFALLVSAAFVALMAGLIIFETQNIVRGGETNYILATVTLFVSIYNLFTSLLHLIGFFGGEE